MQASYPHPWFPIKYRVCQWLLSFEKFNSDTVRLNAIVQSLQAPFSKIDSECPPGFIRLNNERISRDVKFAKKSARIKKTVGGRIAQWIAFSLLTQSQV